jgi:hypothetical protein
VPWLGGVAEATRNWDKIYMVRIVLTGRVVVMHCNSRQAGGGAHGDKYSTSEFELMVGFNK